MTNNKHNMMLNYQQPDGIQIQTHRKVDDQYLKRRLDEIRLEACIYGADRRG